MPGTPSTQRVVVQSVKTHRDARGSVFEPLTAAELAGQKYVHVVLTQPNEVRGNHAHRTAVETTSVVGPCLIRLKEAGVIRDIDVPEGEIWRLTNASGSPSYDLQLVDDKTNMPLTRTRISSAAVRNPVQS